MTRPSPKKAAAMTRPSPKKIETTIQAITNDVFERILFTIAAASGVVTAACISGLTQASCAAMVETYGRATILFGLVACMAILGALSSVVSSRFLQIVHGIGLQKIFSRHLKVTTAIISIFAVYFFVAAIFTSAYNLPIATMHCFVGTDV